MAGGRLRGRLAIGDHDKVGDVLKGRVRATGLELVPSGPPQRRVPIASQPTQSAASRRRDFKPRSRSGSSGRGSAEAPGLVHLAHCSPPIYVRAVGPAGPRGGQGRARCGPSKTAPTTAVSAWGGWRTPARSWTLPTGVSRSFPALAGCSLPKWAGSWSANPADRWWVEMRVWTTAGLSRADGGPHRAGAPACAPNSAGRAAVDRPPLTPEG